MILITCSDYCELITAMIGTANKIRTLNNIYESMLCSDCVILIACYDYCDLLTAKIGTANKYTKMIYMILIPYSTIVAIYSPQRSAQPMRTLNDLRDTNHMF